MPISLRLTAEKPVELNYVLPGIENDRNPKPRQKLPEGFVRQRSNDPSIELVRGIVLEDDDQLVRGAFHPANVN